MKMKLAILFIALILLISGITMVVFAQSPPKKENPSVVEPQTSPPCCCGATVLIVGLLGLTIHGRKNGR